MLALVFLLVLTIIYSVLYYCDIPTMYFFVGVFILLFMMMLWSAFRLMKTKTAVLIILGVYWIITFPLTVCFVAIRIAMKDNISIELLQMFSWQSMHGILRYHCVPLFVGLIFLLLLFLLSCVAAKKVFPQYRFKKTAIKKYTKPFHSGLNLYQHLLHDRTQAASGNRKTS